MMAIAIGRVMRGAAVIGVTGWLCGVAVVAVAATPANPAGDFRLAQAGGPQKAAPSRPSAAEPETGANAVERQMADLRQKLHITPAQQPQFDAFAKVMQQNAQAIDALAQQEQANQKRNAVEQLRASAQAAKEEADGLARLVPAFEALYASLSAPQKQTADRLFAEPAQPEGAPPARR